VKELTVTCPNCRDPNSPVGKSSKHFPFCSERCRDIDLGGWIDGSYRIGQRSAEGGDLPEQESGTLED